MVLPSQGPGTTLQEVRVRRPVSITGKASLARVAQILRKENVSCALLDEMPVRIVTERDLARAWESGHGSETAVADIAVDEPVWVTDTTSVAVAAAMMIDYGIRHLVVMDPSGDPAGVVSMRELFEILLRSHEPATVFASFAAVLMRTAT